MVTMTIHLQFHILVAGYEDLNDHDFRRNDLCFQTAIGRNVNPRRSLILCWFENTADRRNLVDINKWLVKHFIDHQQTALI